MRAVKDLCGTMQPSPFDVIYNTNEGGSGSTARYRGSLVKAQDHDRRTNGKFFTFAGDTTALENVCGILEEDVAASTTYLMNVASGSGNYVRRKMTPITGTTVIEAEYVHKDAAGTDNRDSGFAVSAAGTTVTANASIGTADILIGSWVYFLTGSNANYLHYIRDNNSTTGITLRTAVVNAVTATDYFLLVQPALVEKVDFNATYTDIKSEFVAASNPDEICGIETFISAPGIPKQKLDQAKHDGKYIANARFFHHFTLPYENYWTSPNRA